MANSSIEWIDITFNWSVVALYEVAGWFNITYEEINVWIFCVAWPILTLLLVYAVFSLVRQNRQLRREAHV